MVYDRLKFIISKLECGTVQYICQERERVDIFTLYTCGSTTVHNSGRWTCHFTSRDCVICMVAVHEACSSPVSKTL